MSSARKAIDEVIAEIQKIDPWINVRDVDLAHSGKAHYLLEKNGETKKFFGSAKFKTNSALKNFLQYVRQWARKVPDPETVGASIEKAQLNGHTIQVPRESEPKPPEPTESEAMALIDRLEATALRYGTEDLQGRFVSLPNLKNRNGVDENDVRYLANRYPKMLRVETKHPSTQGGRRSTVLRFLSMAPAETEPATPAPVEPEKPEPIQTPKKPMPKPAPKKSEEELPALGKLSIEKWFEIVDYVAANAQEFDGKPMAHGAELLSKHFGMRFTSSHLSNKKALIEDRAKIKFQRYKKNKPQNPEFFNYVDPLHLADCIDTGLRLVEDVSDRLSLAGVKETEHTQNLVRKLEAMHAQLKAAIGSYYEAVA